MPKGRNIRSILSNLWDGTIKSEEALRQLNDAPYGFNKEEPDLLNLLNQVSLKKVSIDEFLQETGLSFSEKIYSA